MTIALVADILARGELAIDEIIRDRREESLHLEFKTLSGSNGLNRDDRKMIAKAPSGFCNAEGGVLIVGVETAKVDGIDVASKFASHP